MVERKGDALIKFMVDAVPVAKGRPRFSVRGGFARAYTPAKTRSYEELVAVNGKVAMKGRKPLECALIVKIWAYMPIPKATTKRDLILIESGQQWHTKKPDADNIGKSATDALNGVCWVDDSQIVSLTVEKHYSDTPRIEITIEEKP